MPNKHKSAKSDHKNSTKKLVKKSIKKGELEAFSKGQTYADMMEEETEGHGQKMVSFLLQGKKEAKKEVLGQFGKNAEKLDPKTALILIFATDLNGEKELFPREKLFQLLEGLRVLNVKTIVVDTEQPSDINNLGELPEHHQGHVIWYNPKQDNSGRGREEKEIDRLFLAADIAITFDNHHELIKLLMNYGVVMVGEDRSPFLENYRPNEETGNAFLFNKKDLWSVFAALVRALETFKFPYDWNHIVRKIYK
jgi:hypothetical protein